MNRVEFMTALDALLQDISIEERTEAMQYYNDYFDDAGIEQEDTIIKELGSPAKVAAEVKAGLKMSAEETSEYRETGYADTRFEYKETPANHEREAKKENAGEYNYAGDVDVNTENQPRTNKTVKMILIVLIALTVLPIVCPIAIGLLAAFFSILVAIVAVIFAMIIVLGVLIVVGIALVVAGIAVLIPHLASGLALIGIGLVTSVIGVVATVIAIKGCVIVIPAIFRTVVRICRKPLEKRGKAVT